MPAPTETYTSRAGKPPTPGETAMYRSMSAFPVEGRVANVVGVFPKESTASTLSDFCWVTSSLAAVHAIPTGCVTEAKNTGPVTLSRVLWNTRFLLSGDQL